MKYFTGIFLSLLCLTTACQKKDNTAPDVSKLKMQISNPLSSIIYHKGDTVFIRAAVSYITQMHGYNVRISDTANGTTYYETEDHVHGDSFDIDEYWVNTLDQAGVLRLRFTVILDHDGSSEYKDLLITTQP